MTTLAPIGTSGPKSLTLKVLRQQTYLYIECTNTETGLSLKEKVRTILDFSMKDQDKPDDIMFFYSEIFIAPPPLVDLEAEEEENLPDYDNLDSELKPILDTDKLKSLGLENRSIVVMAFSFQGAFEEPSYKRPELPKEATQETDSQMDKKKDSKRKSSKNLF